MSLALHVLMALTLPTALPASLALTKQQLEKAQQRAYALPRT